MIERRLTKASAAYAVMLIRIHTEKFLFINKSERKLQSRTTSTYTSGVRDIPDAPAQSIKNPIHRPNIDAASKPS